METETRFDLNAAIAGWRQELAAQPGLAPDDRRELETHLRDTVAGLRERGLNDEESFWLARRRVGRPQQLAEEFVKVDPANVWRGRVFWMALGLFGLEIWSPISQLWEMALRNFLNRLPNLADGWVWYYFPSGFQNTLNEVLRGPAIYALWRFLPLILFAVLLARGRMKRVMAAGQFCFQSRRHFLVSAAALLMFHFASIGFMFMQFPYRAYPPESLMFQIFRIAPSTLIVPVTIVLLIAWLMPGKKTSAKQA